MFKSIILLIALLVSNVSYGAFQKEKTLESGVTGNYWAVSHMAFRRSTTTVDLVVSLYKDSTPGLAPIGLSQKFSFVITPQDLTGNLITWAHTKILAYANSDITNINGVGTHKGFPDLIGATVVP